MKVILFFVFIIMVFSCSNENEGPILDNCICVEVDLDKSVESIDLKNIVSKYEYIPLETIEQSLIGRISKVIFFDNKYLVVDKQRNRIFIFDRKGKFVREIGRKGKGAHEFIKIRDVAISNDSCIVVMGAIKPIRLISYSFSNEFKSERILNNTHGERFAITKKNRFLVHYSCPVKSNRGYRLFILDNKGELLSKYLPFRKTNDVYKASDNCFTSYQNIHLFNLVNSDTIFQIDKDLTFSPRYSICFGKYTIPTDIKVLFDTNFDEFMEKSDGYVDGINSFFETDDYLVFTFDFKGKGYGAFYTKANGEIMLSNHSNFFNSQFMNPISVIGNDLVSILNPSDLFSLRDQIQLKFGEDKWEQFCEENLISNELLNSINEMSNPVLIRYSINNN